SELRTHHEAQARSELVRLAPAYVRTRATGAVGGTELVAWAARIVGDDGRLRVHYLHEIPDHAVRIDRGFIPPRLQCPALHPRGTKLRDLALDRSSVARLAFEQVLAGVDELPQHELRVAEHRMVGVVGLVVVDRVGGGVDDDLAPGNIGAHVVLG